MDKREAILQAALELIAEYGFQHTPMSLIAKRSGASAGIIYHYFESKDELIHVLYRRVKNDLGRALLSVDIPQQTLAERFLILWIGIFRYCLAHPHETLFLEQYESLPAQEQQAFVLGEEGAALHALTDEFRMQESVKDLPFTVINELTFGIALRLALQATTGQISIDDTMLATIAGACWDAIRKHPEMPLGAH